MYSVCCIYIFHFTWLLNILTIHISINNLTNTILRSYTILYLSNLLKYIYIRNYFNKKNNRSVCIIILLDDFYFHINIIIITYKSIKTNDLLDVLFLNQLRKSKLFELLIKLVKFIS